MLRIRDIMTADVLTLAPQTTVREAMEVLAHRHVSGAPVLNGDHLVGVVTATDLMTFAAALTGVPTERDLCSAWDNDEPESDEDDEDESEEGATFSTFFNEMWDDAGADVADRIATTASPEWNALEAHEVSEVMTRSPLITTSPDASAESAADLMGRNNIHRVLVTNDGALCGIVTALDITRAVADHRFTRRTFVFD